MVIFQANQAMIESCDIIIANLNPFRGPELDSGTVWKVGYALGLWKPVVGYMNNPEKQYFQRVDINFVDEEGIMWRVYFRKWT